MRYIGEARGCHDVQVFDKGVRGTNGAGKSHEGTERVKKRLYFRRPKHQVNVTYTRIDSERDMTSPHTHIHTHTQVPEESFCSPLSGLRDGPYVT